MIARFILSLALALMAPLAATQAAQVQVREFQRGSFQEILHEYPGQPIIVHFWGLSCGPCLVELPEWGRLLHERPDLHLVAVHADRLPSDFSFLTERLDDDGLAKAQNWAFGGVPAERLRYEVDPSWRGEIPMTLLIAADGTAQRILGTADMAKIAGWLDAQATPGAHRNDNLPQVETMSLR
jgi:thiol-disulfide isomerase/thioredoxin